MFLKAGAISILLLLASRLLGLARESAQAASFGASGLADTVVLMLTLPDWLAGFLVAGALGYVLVPAWAGQPAARVAATQRRVALVLVGAGMVLALALAAVREGAAQVLAPGLPPSQGDAASAALVWSAAALPAALLAALWTTRLQHERDFTGMYAANLVVNGVLIIAIVVAGRPGSPAIALLGIGLLAAMALRLAWLQWRTPVPEGPPATETPSSMAWPGVSIWVWAALSSGLPLALPFAARSIASHDGPGALATFNYAWKLVELPLVLAIQVVATLAFPAIARAHAAGDRAATTLAIRHAFALAWTLACACVAGLLVAAPAVAQLLFGWGRMDDAALARIAQWGTVGAWSLLPQAVIAVALSALAARSRMRSAVAAYAVALAVLLAGGAYGWTQGGQLMVVIDGVLGLVAIVALLAVGPGWRAWLPLRTMILSLAALAGIAALCTLRPAPPAMAVALAEAALAAAVVLASAWWSGRDLREALAR